MSLRSTEKIKMTKKLSFFQVGVYEDGERTKKTHPLILVSPPTGDWEVIQPGNEPSSKGDYEPS